MRVPFGPDLHYADGPEVSFFGFPYSTRMAVARLSSCIFWVWSPVALTSELASAVEALGPVALIVSPNKLHHPFIAEWHARWPSAQIYAPAGLVRCKRQISFDAVLGDRPEDAGIEEIDQALFRGSFAMEEVVFFHRDSRTAIVGDGLEGPADEAGWPSGSSRQHSARVGA